MAVYTLPLSMLRKQLVLTGFREHLTIQRRSHNRIPSICASSQVKGQRAKTENRTLQGIFSQKTMFKLLLMTVNRSIIKFKASCSLFQKLIPSKAGFHTKPMSDSWGTFLLTISNKFTAQWL